MTVRAAVAAIRALGMAAKHHDGEYRVTFHVRDVPSAQDRERAAYYTNDPHDAVATARAMMAEVART